MGIVEGLTATIAAHNPDVDFETVWASDSEEPKLDIYYREAVTDLENALAKYSTSTTKLFDLQALADDFSLTIRTLAYWPPRLTGLLTNQVQNYLVHAIMAGWIADINGVQTIDYASMGVTDMDAIKEILLKKDFDFGETERHKDDADKDKGTATDTQMRTEEGEGKEDNVQHVDSRTEDLTDKDGGETMGVSGRNEDDGHQHFCHERTDWSGGRPPRELR